MTRARLLLLTTRFPFGVGEEFLEDELPYLAARFASLTIAPLTAAGPLRPVPAHARVEPGLAHALLPHRWHPRAGDLSRALAHDLLARSCHPRAALRGLRHVLRAQRIADWLAHHVDPRAPTLCYAYWLGPAALAATLLRETHPRLRVIARGHGADLYAERHRPQYIPLLPYLLERLDRAHAISQHGLERMLQLAPGHRSQFQLSRLGAPEPVGACSASRDGTLRLLSCSNMAPVKRLERIVSGIAAFAASTPALRVEWCHLGGGPGHAAFAAHARSRLAGRVRLELPGHTPHGDVARYYASHPVDGFINLSASEGLPVSIMEAMSFGVPVIATAVGGTPELVNADNGWLLPAQPTDAQVATALRALHTSDAETLAARRAQAQASWRALVHAPTQYARFARELTDLMEPLDHGHA